MNHANIICRDAAGRVTFSTDIRTIRVMQRRVISSNSTGSIPLSELPSGLEGVALIPVNAALTTNIAPYCWVASSRFNWRGSRNNYYLMILDIVGLGGSTSLPAG